MGLPATVLFRWFAQTARLQQLSGILLGILCAVLFVMLFRGELKYLLHRIAPCPPYLPAVIRLAGLGFMVTGAGLLLKFVLPADYRGGMLTGFIVACGIQLLLYARTLAYRAAFPLL